MQDEVQELPRAQKIKNHFSRNREFYIYAGLVVGSSVLSVAVAEITRSIVRDHSLPIRVAVGEPAQGAVGVLGKKVKIKDSTLNTVSYISANRQGPPSWIIRCKETGEVFVSQKAAALAMNLPMSHISLHLNGKMKHVRGFTFERIAMAA